MAEAQGASDRAVLLYYKYVVPLWSDDETNAMMAWQEREAKERGLSGRVRVASEGLNVNISGGRQELESYCGALNQWQGGVLAPIDFKLAETRPDLEFRGLKVWQTKELCALGAEIDPESPGGRHISPQEFHTILENAKANSTEASNVILLDARNMFETRVGQFQVTCSKGQGGGSGPAGAPAEVRTIAPPTNAFSELPRHLEALPAECADGTLEGKTVLMYCTGGVRCERASQYLRSAHPDANFDVAQLSGGIHRYLEAYPDGGFWVGVNYVFDRRESHGPTKGTSAAGGTGGTGMPTSSLESSVCLCCRAPWASYRGKRRCAGCRGLVLVCDLCQSRAADRNLPKPGPQCEQCARGSEEADRPAKQLRVAGPQESLLI